MTNHNFNFEGGDILRGIGASFMVSYLYFYYIDNSHKNWELVATAKNRISRLMNSKRYHTIWLEYVLSMNINQLEKNTMNLKGLYIKKMAMQLLQKLT